MLSKVSVIIVLSSVYYITPSDERNAVPIMQSDSGMDFFTVYNYYDVFGNNLFHVNNPKYFEQLFGYLQSRIYVTGKVNCTIQSTHYVNMFCNLNIRIFLQIQKHYD